MRTVLRLTGIACALLFGIPAVALLLAHMGFIALPADPYVSSVGATSAPVMTYNTSERNPLDLARTARAAAGRAAIVGANAVLPHYQRGVNRPWSFHEPGRASQDIFAQVTVCNSCPTGKEILSVVATVDSIYDDRAEVRLKWSLHNERRIRRSNGERTWADPVAQRGEVTVRLQNHDGRWHAVEAW
jgi:hypothetical protein